MTWLGPGQAGLRRYAAGIGADSPLLASLIAYWKMDEASGQRNDSYGTYNLADNGGVSQAAGKINNAASFVATQYLSIADQSALRANVGSWTMDGWIYIPTPSTTQEILTKSNNTSGFNVEYRLFCASSALTWRVYNTGGSAASVNIGSISANTWAYFCVWYDPTDQKAYGQINNNTPVASTALSGTVNGVAQPLVFGVAGDLASLPFTGRLDEVGRWNRLLTGTERADRYNAGNGLAYPF
jgi:hypothetical protein